MWTKRRDFFCSDAEQGLKLVVEPFVSCIDRACCHIVEKEAPQGHPVVAGEAGSVDHSRICSSRNIAMIGGEGGG